MLDSEIVYQNPWITVREDQVIGPDGENSIYGVVETRLAVGVLALNVQDELYLVGQYRYPTDQYSWEIVEGGADAGEDAQATAMRELKEEAGLTARTWRRLGGDIHLSNCISAEAAQLFVATDLTEGENCPEASEVLQVKKVPFTEALAMVMRGELKDAMTITGILLLAREREI